MTLSFDEYLTEKAAAHGKNYFRTGHVTRAVPGSHYHYDNSRSAANHQKKLQNKLKKEIHSPTKRLLKWQHRHDNLVKVHAGLKDGSDAKKRAGMLIAASRNRINVHHRVTSAVTRVAHGLGSHHAPVVHDLFKLAKHHLL